MSNQEPQNQDKTNEDTDVQKRRRFIKGASVAAPVVLTLANRSVFGNTLPCLSQQISGNMSHIGEGSCESGQPPTAWRGNYNNQPIPIIGTAITNITPNGQPVVVRDEEMINKQVIASYTGNSYPPGTKVKIVQNIKVIKKTYYWYGTNFIYGDLFITEINTRIFRGTNFTNNVFEEITVEQVTSAAPNTDKYNPPKVVVGAKFKTGTQWAYTNADGTKNPDDTTSTLSIWPSGYSLASPLPAKCSDFASGTGTTMQAAFGDPGASSISMREILCANASSHDSFCSTAMLNASYNLPPINYVCTVEQVKALCANPPTSPYPPGYASVWDFFASTWLNLP